MSESKDPVGPSVVSRKHFLEQMWTSSLAEPLKKLWSTPPTTSLAKPMTRLPPTTKPWSGVPRSSVREPARELAKEGKETKDEKEGKKHKRFRVTAQDRQERRFRRELRNMSPELLQEKIEEHRRENKRLKVQAQLQEKLCKEIWSKALTPSFLLIFHQGLAKRGIWYDELAEELGVDREIIYDYGEGTVERPNTELIGKMGEALQVKLPETDRQKLGT